MSIEAYNYSITLKVGDLGAKFVHGRLADRADERFTCFPSVPLIAAEMEKSERTVQRALAYLRERGLISDRENFRPDGSQTTNRYQLHGPWDEYGGTGVPFPQIVTPRQARAEMWAQAPAEGAFREGTAAAVALLKDGAAEQEARRRAAVAQAHAEAIEESKSRRGKKAAVAPRKGTRGEGKDLSPAVPPGEEGVTAMSPAPPTQMSPAPMTPMSPLEPSAPSHSGDDVFPDGRRPSDRSNAGAREGGCAASGKDSPAPSKKQPKHSRQELDLVAAVRKYFPQELAVPDVPAVSDAVLKALATGQPDSRTVEQLGSRIETRWHTHRWAMKVLEGEEIKSPVGVAINLVRAYGRGDKWGCANPRCEAGVDVDTGAECNVCPERLEARKAARRAEVQPQPLASADDAPEQPEQPAEARSEPDYYPDDVRGDGEGEPPAWAVLDEEPVVPAQGGGLDEFAAARAAMRDGKTDRIRRTNQYAR